MQQRQRRRVNGGGNRGTSYANRPTVYLCSEPARNSLPKLAPAYLDTCWQ